MAYTTQVTLLALVKSTYMIFLTCMCRLGIDTKFFYKKLEIVIS